MILSELRAQAWKYATFALSVLAVALLIVGLLFWVRGTRADARADAAEQRAEASAAELRTVKEALARDGVSDGFTATAQQAMDTNAAAITSRLSAIEGRLHDRAPVPVVCPEPDPVLVRDAAEAASRIRAAEGRLRSLRTTEG
jgi:hypothetical protein